MGRSTSYQDGNSLQLAAEIMQLIRWCLFIDVLFPFPCPYSSKATFAQFGLTEDLNIIASRRPMIFDLLSIIVRIISAPIKPSVAKDVRATDPGDDRMRWQGPQLFLDNSDLKQFSGLRDFYELLLRLT